MLKMLMSSKTYSILLFLFVLKILNARKILLLNTLIICTFFIAKVGSLEAGPL